MSKSQVGSIDLHEILRASKIVPLMFKAIKITRYLTHDFRKNPRIYLESNNKGMLKTIFSKKNGLR